MEINEETRLYLVSVLARCKSIEQWADRTGRIEDMRKYIIFSMGDNMQLADKELGEIINGRTNSVTRTR